MNSSTRIGLAVLAVAVVGGFLAFSGGSGGAVAGNQVYAESGTFTYQDYSETELQENVGENPVAVFVHSKACGTCRGKSEEIIEEAGTFPQDTQVLKMEYGDMPSDFRMAYSVQGYDTFVVFDANGEFRTQRGLSVDDLKRQLQ